MEFISTVLLVSEVKLSVKKIEIMSLSALKSLCVHLMGC